MIAPGAAVGTTPDGYRERLGSRLIFTCTVALVVLGAFVMGGAIVSELRGNAPNAIKDTAQLLFSALLPLLGTWVGTILAFYYSKENYEAGTRGAIDAVRSAMQRLGSTAATDVMMSRAMMVTLDVPAGKAIEDVLLSAVVAKFKTTGANGLPISRLPVVSSDGACVAFLHRGVWSEMLAADLIARGAPDMGTATLGTLLGQAYPPRKDTTYAQFVRAAVAVVARGASVADAKAAMEQVPGCQDVIVTGSGTRAEPVLGWISNIDIGRLSKA